MELLISWLISSVAVLITSYLLPGITLKNFWTAVIAAAVLGIINAFLKPLIILLTLPINILTLGLFTFIINALLIMLVGVLVPGFDVRGFWWALLFSIILSIITYFLSRIFG